MVQIVCGAPNVAVGQKVPVATIGTMLYDAQGNPWEIKKGKIRGEESHGMICAEDELGLGQGHEGIMILDESLVPGTPCAQVFQIENDEVFEIGLTPNRADAMSHHGVARDLKAGLIQKGVSLELISPSTSSFHVNNRTLKIDVEVENNELAPRYAGVTITGVKVAESPDWIKNRLKAIGLTPKNNIVDITNYVLHELGQPLHAFDAAKISGNKILVKTVADGTKFTTLDEVERTLHSEDLMICDAEKPLCIAGVFGGLSSGVTENTTQIFLESAYFNPVSVRKTAKRHGLSTDASFRFERGIDINNVKYALLRAAILIQQVAGGEISMDVTDIYPKKVEDFQVFLAFEKVDKLIGQEIPKEVIKNILTSLDMKINSVTERGVGLSIPPYRVDVQRDVDVIEEILRIYGYNQIDFTEKLNATVSHSSRYEDYKVQNIIANQLVGQGFNEMMANSLTSSSYTKLSEQLKEEHNVMMLNPLSADLSAMRQSMLFSGLEAIAYNSNRRRPDLKLFEFGKTYHRYENYTENKHLSLFITGDRFNESWNTISKKSDFFYLKGVLQTIFDRLGLSKLKSAPFKTDVFQEGLILSSGKIRLAEFGIVKKSILKAFDIKQEVVYADIDWKNVHQLVQNHKVSFKELAKYPEVRRDLALLLDESVTFEQLHHTAMQSEKSLLKDMSLFDVYQGKNLPEGKKSYALSFVLQDEEQTLTDKQIEKVMSKLQQNFEKQLGAELRK